MEIKQRRFYAYTEAHSSPPDSVLLELERETNLKALSPQMISGPIQGKLLYFLSSMMQPTSILEVGTFTGYATICLARGLAKGGFMHTIEVNEELESIIRKYIDKAGLTEQVVLHMGDAREIIPTIDGNFDLILIDAAKKDNSVYFDILIERLRPGGLMIADNVLWDGKVAQKEKDKTTQIIDNFNKKVHADERVENLILPIRDGILVMRKK